jgi:hypothetical protein
LTDSASPAHESSRAGRPGPGAGNGFAASPADFALPPGYSSTSGAAVFSNLASLTQGTACNGQNVPEYAVTDLTGDGKPDLVVTQACSDASVGNDKWLVYANTGSGFAASPGDFALPHGYSSTIGPVFPDVAGPWNDTACNGQNTPVYAVTDLTGDGKPDLVVMQACSDVTVGNAKWFVYANTGSGFAANPSDFALPQGYSSTTGPAVFAGLASVSQGTACNGQNVPDYAVSDLTGDGKPDLVVTQACSDATVGNAKWLLYANSGSGFAASPSDFTLPPGYTSTTVPTVFSSLASSQGTACNGQNIPGYAVADLTGDGKPDLVVTQACSDPTVGNAKWLLYANGGSGFAASPTDFALPQGYSSTTMPAVFPDLTSPTPGTACNGQNIPDYTLSDMTGDGKPDIVVTQACSDATVGNAKWLLYAGNCH